MDIYFFRSLVDLAGIGTKRGGGLRPRRAEEFGSYVDHSHREQNPQGLESRNIRPQVRDGRAGEVERLGLLGDLLNFYYWEAG